MNNLSRRGFLAGFTKAVGVGTASFLCRARLGIGVPFVVPPIWLREAHELIRGIKQPRIARRGVRLKPIDGDARAMIQEAIDSLNSRGGGRVSLAPGEWRVNGPIRYRSGIDLHLEAGARLIFSARRADYLPLVRTRWEGTDLFGYSPLLYAYQVRDVALSGAGSIEMEEGGDVADWRFEQTEAQRRLRAMGASGAPLEGRIFGAGLFLRPSCVQFFECERVLVDGVRLGAIPFWGVHCVYSEHVVVRGVVVDSLRVNNDGVDIDSSRHVLVERCVFNTGDDCIAIKAGRDLDGRMVGRPSENIVIRECKMLRGKSAGIAIGSEMSGGVRRVYIYRCEMGDVETVFNVKSNLDRGGFVEHLRVWNVSARQAARVVQITTSYHGYIGGNFPPRIEDIEIDDLRCQRAREGIAIKGVPASPVKRIKFKGVSIDSVAKPLVATNASQVEFERVLVNGETLSAALLKKEPSDPPNLSLSGDAIS
jgi:hypothetical protein